MIKDDGKRYNVWLKKDNRWTNRCFDLTGSWIVQDPNNPRSLTYQEAQDVLDHIGGSDFEIRELPTNTVNQPTSVPVAKSNGMNCACCNDHNPYAEINHNGKYLCYSCRSSGRSS
jgi:hypothetical protein